MDLDEMPMLIKTEVFHGLSKIDFRSPKTNLASAPAMTSICSTIKQFWVPVIAPLIQMINQTAGIRLITQDYFFPQESFNLCNFAIFATFHSFWNRVFLWIWIYFPCPQCFCQNHYLWTYGMFSCCLFFPHNPDYNKTKTKQRTHLIACKAWTHAHEIY